MKKREPTKITFQGWEFLAKKGIWELWKTPTMFLVCYHYGRQCYFFSTKSEAEGFLNLQSSSDDLDVLRGLS